MANALFVTSTGTEIGKTFVTAALIHQMRAAGLAVDAFKPLLSGFEAAAAETTDTGILLKVLGKPIDETTINAMTPWRFVDALSPDMAARRAGATINFDELCAFTRTALNSGADVTLVEGVGGLMAPVGEGHTVVDWLGESGLPALLVIGGYLGTISHTLTAIEVMRARGIPVAGVVVSAQGECPVPPEETIEAISRFARGLRFAVVPDMGAGPERWKDVPDLLGPLGLAS